VIDVATVVGARLPAVTLAWDEDDVILYHLALGAGVPPTDPRELAYTYEPGLKVLPTFAVVQAFPVLYGLAGVPGLEYDPTNVLHGEQEVTVREPLPVRAEVETSGRVAAVYDKGSGALTVVEATTRALDGGELASARFSLFMRGAGGFDGDRGPGASYAAPEGPPDAEFARTTLPQQALLYRLCGDKNPLHADPEAAAHLGFERPILHGLATYGIVCRAVVDELLGGDVARVARYGARFSGIVFPGDTLVVRAWSLDDGYALHALVDGRRTPVLDGRLAVYGPQGAVRQT
jgi:acyl dehydratase